VVRQPGQAAREIWTAGIPAGIAIPFFPPHRVEYGKGEDQGNEQEKTDGKEDGDTRDHHDTVFLQDSPAANDIESPEKGNREFRSLDRACDASGAFRFVARIELVDHPSECEKGDTAAYGKDACKSKE
jgi:hypothetical protein